MIGIGLGIRKDAAQLVNTADKSESTTFASTAAGVRVRAGADAGAITAGSSTSETTIQYPLLTANLVDWWTATGLSAGAIASWGSQVAGGHTLAQATGSKQPIAAATGGSNNQAMVTFDGTDDWMAVTFTQAQPVHVYMVAKWDTAFSLDATIIDGGASTNTMRLFRAASTTVAANAGSNIIASANTTPQTWHLWELVFNGASSEIRQDGTQKASGDAGAGAPGGVTLGSIGAHNLGWAPCSISSVLLYSAVKTGAEHTNIKAWFATTYGLTVA